MMLEHDLLLWMSALLPLYGWFAIRSWRRTNRWLAAFAGTGSNVTRFAARLLAAGISLACLTVALAEPKVQYEKTTFNRAGIQIAFGLDVSKSMLAEDVTIPPEARQHFRILNRLNQARVVALSLLSQLQGESIGAFIFARDGIEIVPFTRDYGYCRYIFSHINDADITAPGSGLANAIRTGIHMLERSKDAGAKFLVLLSDGEDTTADPTDVYESARYAAGQGIRILTVGIGSIAGGFIPIRSDEQVSIRDYYLDAAGDHLKTRLVPDTLQAIADLAGGRYFPGDNASALIPTLLKKAEGVAETRSTELAWFSLAPVFVLAGLVAFALEAVIGS